MRTSALWIAVLVATATLLSACKVVHDKWTMIGSDGSVVIRETTTWKVIFDGDYEVTYDWLGRPIYRLKIRGGPHHGETWDFPTKNSAINGITTILQGSKWADGEPVTEEDLARAKQLIDRYWVDPVPGKRR